MAVTFTHPLDQTKYRMQVMQAPKAMLRTLVHFASRDGIRSLWTGLTASYARQLSYSTARFGLYNYFAGEMRKQTGKQRLSISMEIMSSGFAGGLAGFIGNPSEVCKTLLSVGVEGTEWRRSPWYGCVQMGPRRLRRGSVIGMLSTLSSESQEQRALRRSPVG